MSYEDQGEAGLLHAARRDPGAFEELFERHAVALRRWLFVQTRDAALAQDLVAETFAAAWLGLRRFRGEDDRQAVGWLYGIARNLLRHSQRRGGSEQRARRRLGMCLPAGDDGGLEGLTERLDSEQLAPAVREAFDELTPEQRQAIGYRVIDELSYREVAAQMECDPATVRTRVFRGLQALRATIENQDTGA